LTNPSRFIKHKFNRADTSITQDSDMKKQTTRRISTYLSLSLSVGSVGLAATSANAQIVYTQTTITADIGYRIWWNPNAGSAENVQNNVAPKDGGLQIFNSGGNLIYTDSSPGTYLGTTGGSTLDRFLADTTIGINTNWYSNATYMLHGSDTTPWKALGPDHSGYVAFSFLDTSSQLRYGWADFSYSNPGTDAQTLTLNGYAYQKDGTAITPGDTGVTAVPEPSTLKLSFLVLGASGLVALRRSRKAAGKSLPPA
jgi:hypothetical protein